MNRISLQTGATLRGGTYRIDRVLGQGGFGITYLATDLSLDKHVAIKEFFLKTSVTVTPRPATLHSVRKALRILWED